MVERIKVDSSAPQSAQATAGTAAASQATSRPSKRESASTTVLSDDQKPRSLQESERLRQAAGTDPFVVSSNDEASQATPDIDQTLIDAIPDQIRKLSDSILNFGKDKK